MLTSLLPGLRELRAPLAAGVLWLVAAYTALVPYIPAKKELNAPFDDLRELADAVGRPGVLAAVVFAAYLVGILAQPPIEGLTRAVVALVRTLAFRANKSFGTDIPQESESRRRKFVARSNDAVLQWTGADVKPPMSADSLAALRRRASDATDAVAGIFAEAPVDQELLDNLITDPDRPRPPLERVALRSRKSKDEASEELVREALRQTPETRLRLLAKNQILHDAIDRTSAEAAFRLQVAPPLAVLAITIAVRDSWLWLLSFVAVNGLLITGVRLMVKDGDLLMQAVDIEETSIAALTDLPSVAQRLVEEAASGAAVSDQGALAQLQTSLPGADE